MIVKVDDRPPPPEVVVRGPMADRLYRPIVEKRWGDIPRELCFWGGAGTGKSFTLMVILVLLLMSDEIGGLRILWCRKTRKSITESSIVTYAKVLRALGMEMSAKPTPSQRQREIFETKAGTNVLVWMSLEDPLSAFSAEYDIVVTEEGIQVSESTYEMAGGRCLRNYAIPWQGLIVLTNPGPTVGWIYRRMFKTKRLTSCRTTIADNPAFYDIQRQELTPAGRQYLEALKHTYTDPTRRRRLLMGEWCSEEGWVFEGAWDDSRHLFSGEYVKAAYTAPKIVLTEPHDVLEAEIPLRWTFASMDLGFVNAGTLQAWGVDADRRMYLLEEVYHTGKDRDWWTERIVEFAKKYQLDCVVSDHNPELHRHWNATIRERHESARSSDGNPFVRRCQKSNGDKDALKVDVVRTLLNNAPDGKPRCFLRRRARTHPADTALEVEAKPTCLEEEIPQLVWKPLSDQQIDEKLPEERLKEGRANHGFDGWVYAGRFLLGKDPARDWTKDKPETHPGTLEHHIAVMEKKGWKTS